jgi:adenosylcobinamide-GDP ribazoletransferase
MGARVRARADGRRPRALRAAVSFLTRVHVRSDIDERDVAASIAWFSVVGAAIGAVSGLVYIGASRWWPGWVAATLAVATSVLITGAFHEDGLGDTADAAGAASTGRDPQPVLKDPRMGAFGVIALVLSLLLRVGALGSLGPHAGFFALVAAHALARGTSAAAVVLAPSAGAGLGSSYATLASRSRGLVAWFIGVAVAASCLRIDGLVAAAACAIVAFGMAVWARRRLGGVSGDVLGAIEQLGEVATLLVAAG